MSSQVSRVAGDDAVLPVVGRRRAVPLQQKRTVVISPVGLPDKQQPPRYVTCLRLGIRMTTFLHWSVLPTKLLIGRTSHVHSSSCSQLLLQHRFLNSQEIGWEERLQNDPFLSSGTGTLNFKNFKL